MGLTIATYVFLVSVVGGLLYFAAPRLSQFAKSLPVIVAFIIALPLVILGLGLFSIVMTAWTENNFLFPDFRIQFLMQFFYPIIVSLAGIFIEKNRIRASYVATNNSIIRANKEKINIQRVLLLLPRCLQKADCQWNITLDVTNCRECGDCIISDFLALRDEYELELEVATGGTIARRLVKELHPSLIIAVACERDLSSGIMDTYPIPVVGIPNIRPEGPCINTQVSMKKVEAALDFFLMRGISRLSFGSA